MQVTKDLVAASATPMVLGILVRGESYGYAILKQINEMSGGDLAWAGETLLYSTTAGGRLAIMTLAGSEGAPREIVSGAVDPTATSDGSTVVFTSTTRGLMRTGISQFPSSATPPIRDESLPTTSR